MANVFIQGASAPMDFDELVSLERGEVDRRILFDEALFERELEVIFGRAWNFLCHETQIPKPGDFFETPIGRDNVLAVRQKDGSVAALVNSCTHKGNAVCRAEEGNVKAFMCTYHGWSFNLAGDLIGVPDADRFYKGRLDKSTHGLRHCAQVDSYHGFVFATMDETAPPLEEYLGATGRLGIDMIAAQDVEAVPGVQKFTINCNWKVATENSMDWYHPQIAHMSSAMGQVLQREVVDAGGAQDTTGDEVDLPGQLTVSDEIAFFGEYGHAMAGPSLDGLPPNNGADHSWRDTPQAQELLGPVGLRSFGHPNVFPNAWITQGLQLSLRIPISPSKTEVWWFSFEARGADEETRKIRRSQQIHAFGPAGLLEQEDGENWAQATRQAIGGRSRTIPFSIEMDLGQAEIIKNHGLAYTEGATSEHGQAWIYYSWAQWMKGVDWAELRALTEPKDKL